MNDPLPVARSLSDLQSAQREQYVRVRIKPLDVPPVKDGVVVGTRAAIGADAIQRMLQLVSHEKFRQIEFPEDEIVGHVIVREAVLRKLSSAKFAAFIRERIKPLMTDMEILLLDVDVEVVVEDKL